MPAQLPKQTVAPVLSAPLDVSNCTGSANNVAVRCPRGATALWGSRAARDQVGLVVNESAIDCDRRRCVDRCAGAGARQLLRGVLRFEERQDRFAVALVKVAASANSPRPGKRRGRSPPSTPNCRCPCCACRPGAFRVRAAAQDKASGEPPISICWCGSLSSNDEPFGPCCVLGQCLNSGRGFSNG